MNQFLITFFEAQSNERCHVPFTRRIYQLFQDGAWIKFKLWFIFRFPTIVDFRSRAIRLRVGAGEARTKLSGARERRAGLVARAMTVEKSFKILENSSKNHHKNTKPGIAMIKLMIFADFR